MAFSTSLPADEFADFLARLLENAIPDGRPLPGLRAAVDEALERAERCFAGIHRKYYTVDGRAQLNHLNSDHMAAFLYLVGNSAWRTDAESDLSVRLYLLNKSMNGLDLFSAVTLPEVFLLVHPVGSVIGNAAYGEHLVVYQNCTIGSDRGAYPRFGDGVILYAGNTVLGDCTVGDDVVFAARSFLIATDVPSDSLVVGQFPNQKVLPNPTPVIQRMFGT